MSKDLLFDIQLGASGDMLIGSLLDMNADFDKMMSMLDKLKLSQWSITPEKIIKHSIAGTSANVRCKDDTHHRNLADIKRIIKASALPENISKNIITIFEKLSIAEAKIHGRQPDEIHFHEIGAVDSIIDISAFCILVELLKINQIYYNEFPFNKGTINSAHGEIPVPVPAVVELTKNHKSRPCDQSGELITPTAAAILTSLGKQTKPLSFTILESGTGFGTRDHPFASYTRAFIIEAADEPDEKEEIRQLECNIDDMNPQLYPGIIEMLLDAGALDAYISAITMKKGRPGNLITVIANIEKIPGLKNIIYNNTTTLGLRIFTISREKLRRKYESVFVFEQEIKIKIGYFNNNIVNIQPEFEDCRKAAGKLNISLKEVMAEALYQYKDKIKNRNNIIK